MALPPLIQFLDRDALAMVASNPGLALRLALLASLLRDGVRHV